MYFFDLDGSLMDSNGAWAAIDRAFLSRYGVENVPADYTEYVTHHSFRDAAAYTRQRYAHDMTEEEIMDTWRAMARESYEGKLPLKPGAEAFLKEARARGIRCAMLTSCLPDLCACALKGHGVDGYFERIFTSVELEIEKCDPKLYHTVAEACGEKPEHCIFFEDSPLNCAAAVEAGWQVYGMGDPLFADRAEELEKICGAGRYPFSFENPLP